MGTDAALFGVPTSQPLVVDTGDAIGISGGSGSQAACLRMLSAEGTIQSTGSTLVGWTQVDVCQDHMINAPDSDECGATLCSSSTTDTQHPGVTNGGVCITIPYTGVPTAGRALLLGRLELTLVTNGTVGYPDTRGADGLPCTYDDTAVPAGPSFPIVLTNAPVGGAILDVDAIDGNTLATLGAAMPVFDPVKAAAGNLSGGTLAGFVTGLHVFEFGPSSPPDSDALSFVRIDCQ
jgi:hypothetical protein